MRLRQVVMAARDLEATVTSLTAVFGIEACLVQVEVDVSSPG